MNNSMLSGLKLICLLSNYTSLTRASRSLHLTTGALSQQLLATEQQLGFSVFERHSRGIRLTQRGQQLVSELSPLFTSISNVVEQHCASSSTQSIRLKLTPSFAFKWLVPRLDQFQRLYPDIQIQTFAEGALVDSDKGDFDIAIDYGPLTYSNQKAELLMTEQLIAVVSPHYVEQHPWLMNKTLPSDWNTMTLLHDAMPWKHASRDHEWAYWARQNGVLVDSADGHFFNRTDMSMSAAEAGVGIALARKALVADEIQNGKLIAPFDAIEAQAGYFLLVQEPSESTEAFRCWLISEIAASNAKG